VAYTLVTKEDAEAIDGIEKLTGLKIERMGKAAPAEMAASVAKTQAKPEAREPRTPREPRPPRETRAPRDSRPPREPKPVDQATAQGVESKSAPRNVPAPQHDDGEDGGWNGPVPGFLSQGFGS
jgi:hypothetical protein